MEMLLKDKIALVIGSIHNIGLAIARALRAKVPK
jgi:NAD(P)-dependent dehydrogenase (short-subunit alcohol dehydrogenase family)